IIFHFINQKYPPLSEIYCNFTELCGISRVTMAKTRGGEELHLSLDVLLGSVHDRILYMFMSQHGLEAAYNLLSEIFKYSKLQDLTQRQAQAELIVKTFLIQPDEVIFGDIDVDPALIKAIIEAVDTLTCTLDMWRCLEQCIKDSINWSAFFNTQMFGDFCNSIRERHPLTLNDLIADCNPIRLRYLEQWIREHFQQHGVGNLLFWVDVQTQFIPLVHKQTPSNVFSIALFEEIQVAVRRIFNVYLADNNANPSGSATAVSDETKKDVLARILMYQGEPFSSQRYASLFKMAQDQVVKWLQSKIFPNFQNSLHFIQCIVEMEWLQADKYAQKMYQAYQIQQSGKRDPRNTVFIPKTCDETKTNFVIENTISKTEYKYAYLTDKLVNIDVCIFSVIKAPPDSKSNVLTFYATVGDIKFQYFYDLFCSSKDCHEDIKQYCLIPGRLPVYIFQKDQRNNTEPKPLVHAFSYPAPSGIRYGLCFTTWMSDEDDTQHIYLPTFTCFLTSYSFWHLVPYLEKKLGEIRAKALEEQNASIWINLVKSAQEQYAESTKTYSLTLLPRYRFFSLNKPLPPLFNNSSALLSLLRDLNVQNVVLALTSILVEHRVIILSKNRESVFFCAEALVSLLAPFQWKHIYLPFCPPNVAVQMKLDSLYIMGIEAVLHYKRSDIHTHRIRSSVCNLQRAHIVLKTPDGSFMYPQEFYSTKTVIIDLDNDEVYTPFKQDLPELPVARVRALELSIRSVQNPKLANSDQFLFQSKPSYNSLCQNIVQSHCIPKVQEDDAIRICFLTFLQSLFGSVMNHFITISNHIDLGKNKPAIQLPRHGDNVYSDSFLVFDVEGFLEANIEMGCREFFRQVFATEMESIAKPATRGGTSRGRTPRVGTANYLRGHVVAAIAEGRNREVAICCMDVEMPHQLFISNMIDTRKFTETIAFLESYHPAEILMVESGNQRPVYQEVRKSYKDSTCRFVALARKYYDQIKGLVDLKRVAANSLDPSVLKNQMITGAAACLLKYIEYNQGVEMAMARPVLLMDYTTISSLELTRSAATGSITESLAGIMDTSRTSVGQRMIRQSIIRPSCDLRVIKARQQFVRLFLDNPSLLFDVVDILPEFANLDKMLTQLVLIPKDITPMKSQQCVVNLIAIKSTLGLLPRLHDCMLKAFDLTDQPIEILESIVKSMDKEEFSTILEAIDQVLDEKSQWNPSIRHMKIEGTLAVRTGIDSKLDIARAAYLKIVNNINNHIDEYCGRYNLKMRLHYTVSRGYHIILQNNSSAKIPEIFIQCVILNKSVACTTKDIHSLNSEATVCLQDIYELSYAAIQTTLDDIRPFAIFSRLIAMSPVYQPYCCPVMASNCSLTIKNGRHPLIEEFTRGISFVPNDVSLNKATNLNILTGSNSSGKTTYLKSTALITIMAHMGCYVPATEAVIPLRTRIFTRLGTSDSIEDSASTFTVEMNDLAFIFDNANDQSLILIDELGRGTSSSDGFALAWCTCERLLSIHAYTLFATHFHGLNSLSNMFSNCGQFHFKELSSKSNVQESEYKLSKGPCQQIHGYGAKAAHNCGIPADIVEDTMDLISKTEVGNVDMDTLVQNDQITRGSRLKKLFNKLNARIHTEISKDELELLLQQSYDHMHAMN
ncbi:mutS protein-like 4, partial [Thraustotheca clavata]